MTAPRTVLASQRKLWRTQAAQGVSLADIARMADRPRDTVRHHLDYPRLCGLRAQAVRIERLYAACNRAVTGAAR